MIIYYEVLILSIANSLLFILYGFLNSISYSLIIFCKFSNHFINHFMNILLILVKYFNQFLFRIYKLGMIWYKLKNSIFVKYIINNHILLTTMPRSPTEDEFSSKIYLFTFIYWFSVQYHTVYKSSPTCQISLQSYWLDGSGN